MNIKRIAILGAGATLLLALTGCPAVDTTISKIDTQEASSTADYELVAPLPYGIQLYKINDLEAGTVCYYTAGGYGVALSCVQVSYIADGTPP